MLHKFSTTFETPAQLAELAQFAISKGFLSLLIDSASSTLTIEADVETGTGYFEAPVAIDAILDRIPIQEYAFDPLVDTSGLSRLDMLHYVACSLVKRGEFPIICLTSDVKELADSLLEKFPFQRKLFSLFGSLDKLIGVARSFASSERLLDTADRNDRVVILTANNPRAHIDECTRAWAVLLPQVPSTRPRVMNNV